MIEDDILLNLFAASAYPHQITPHAIRSAASLLDKLDPRTHFSGYPKTKRLETLTFTISEKIDGTNAGIIVPEDSELELIATSKNGCITVQNDNHGFARWVKENELELRSLSPGHHFGEWYGNKINRNYGLSDRQFVLFNHNRYTTKYFDSGDPTAVDKLPSCVQLEKVLAHDVPIFMLQEFVKQCRDLLISKGSRQVPGFMKPEGLIIRDSHGRVLKDIIDK